MNLAEVSTERLLEARDTIRACFNARSGGIEIGLWEGSAHAIAAACIEAEIQRREWKCPVCGEDAEHCALPEDHLICPEAPPA